jgi:hypothetical protein
MFTQNFGCGWLRIIERSVDEQKHVVKNAATHEELVYVFNVLQAKSCLQNSAKKNINQAIAV